MQYEEFVSRTQDLPFVSDADTAEAAIKAVAGILASSLDEAHAALLANRLPGPLTFDKLRGNQQVQQSSIDLEQALNSLTAQFGLEQTQSEELLQTVVDCIGETVDANSLAKLQESLPQDWKRLFTIH